MQVKLLDAMNKDLVETKLGNVVNNEADDINNDLKKITLKDAEKSMHTMSILMS